MDYYDILFLFFVCFVFRCHSIDFIKSHHILHLQSDTTSSTSSSTTMEMTWLRLEFVVSLSFCLLLSVFHSSSVCPFPQFCRNWFDEQTANMLHATINIVININYILCADEKETADEKDDKEKCWMNRETTEPNKIHTQLHNNVQNIRLFVADSWWSSIHRLIALRMEWKEKERNWHVCVSYVCYDYVYTIICGVWFQKDCFSFTILTSKQ